MLLSAVEAKTGDKIAQRNQRHHVREVKEVKDYLDEFEKQLFIFDG